ARVSLAGLTGLRVLEGAGDGRLIGDASAWQRDIGLGRGCAKQWFPRSQLRRVRTAVRDGGLGDAGRRSRAQVVGGLQPLLPRVEVHARELADLRTLDEEVERLALIDEGPA